MLLTVKDVEYMGNYTVKCLFSDGITKTVNLEPLLLYPAYSELKDEQLFMQFGLNGTLFWANGADIAPEYLYEKGNVIAS